MTTEPLILAIDNGTQSVRALLFDIAGNLVGKGKQEIEPYFSEHPGWAEQHPEYFWQQLGHACARVWQATDARPEQVVGVTVTTQRGTVVNLDRDGHPLRPAILWLDQRHAAVNGPLPGPWGWLFRLTRLEDTVNRFRERAQANWIAQNQPDIWRRTHKYLLLSGYLNYRLTGQYRDSTGSQVGYLPFDYRRQRWAGTRDFKWLALPVTRDMLPELVPPGATLGHLTPDAAKHLGLPAGLPVVAAASEQGLRNPGLRWSGAGHRVYELRHHGHHQHHQPPLRRAGAADASLPLRPARALLYRGDDLPGLLDGELV